VVEAAHISLLPRPSLPFCIPPTIDGTPRSPNDSSFTFNESLLPQFIAGIERAESESANCAL
jgi:hypothetical protein